MSDLLPGPSPDLFAMTFAITAFELSMTLSLVFCTLSVEKVEPFKDGRTGFVDASSIM